MEAIYNISKIMEALWFIIGFAALVFIVFGVLSLKANGFFERFKRKSK